MVKKIIRFDIYIKTTEQTPTYSYTAKQKVMSNDKDSTQITFNLLDVAPEELSGSSASILLYMEDGSFFQKSDVTINRNSVIYTMKPEETRHSGNTKVQIVLNKGTVQTASLIYNFEIERGLEKFPIVEKEIQDWTTLTAEAKAFVEQIKDFTLEGFVENKMGEELANLETNYATRLTGLEQKDNQLTAQLAQTENKLKNAPNTSEPLDLITPYGDNQFTHPKVLDMVDLTGSVWNGYRYWMAYTPLPYYDESKENPCLAVSNDMVNWQLVNPTLHSGIVDVPGSNDYNSDTHLVYRPDTNVLEIWYRGVNETNVTEIIYRRTTTDGVNFTGREVMAGANNGSILNFLSPAVMWDNTRKTYQIWIVNKYQIQYYETPTGKYWQWIKNLKVYFGETTASWHIDVEKTDLGYEMLVATKGKATGVKDSLFHAVFPSMTGQDWADGIKIIEPNPSGWDDEAIYRSCFLKVDGIYYVFYAGVSSNRFYGVGLSISSEPNNIQMLQGTTKNYKRELQAINKTYYAPTNTYLGTHSILDFPANTITICAIETAHATGLPEAMGGVLTTYNWNYSYSFKYQLYMTVTGNHYRRRLKADNTWDNWYKSSATWTGV